MPGRNRRNKRKRNHRTNDAGEESVPPAPSAKRSRVHGVEHRIFRVLVDRRNKEGPYKECDDKTVGRTPDSYLHRCHRRGGFKKHGDANAQQRDMRIQEINRRTNQTTFKPKSTVERVTAQADFECFVLATHPDHEYSEFLKNCKNASEGENLEIMVPHDELLRSYCCHLDEKDDKTTPGVVGRDCKASTIDKILCFSTKRALTGRRTRFVDQGHSGLLDAARQYLQFETLDDGSPWRISLFTWQKELKPETSPPETVITAPIQSSISGLLTPSPKSVRSQRPMRLSWLSRVQRLGAAIPMLTINKAGDIVTR